MCVDLRHIRGELNEPIATGMYSSVYLAYTFPPTSSCVSLTRPKTSSGGNVTFQLLPQQTQDNILVPM